MGITKRNLGITSIVSTTILWVGSQIYRTREVINNVIDTAVYDVLEQQDNIFKEDDGYILLSWVKKQDESEDTFLGNFWLGLKFFYARRLLNLASSENREIRTRAVYHLAKLNTLKNWHYSLLEQMCAAPVAVSLARVKNVDERFFGEPPRAYYVSNSYKLVHSMRQYLTFLGQSDHSCMKTFVNTAFEDDTGISYFYDSDPSSDQITRAIKASPNILPVCLQSILHHSNMEPYVNDVPLQNGLGLLMEVYQYFKEDADVAITVCNILANVSSNKEILPELYRTGWIGILGAWSRHSNIRLSVPAARALANLDRDDSHCCTYARNVYLLHPTTVAEESGLYSSTSCNDIGEGCSPADLDVVFVHGLLGGALYTWRQRDRKVDSYGLIGNSATRWHGDVHTAKGKVAESLTTDSDNLNKLLRSSDPNIQAFAKELEDLEVEEYDNIGQGFEYVLHDIPVSANKDVETSYACSRNEFCAQEAITPSCGCTPTQCWPRDWLPMDCSYTTSEDSLCPNIGNIRVLGLNYDTSLSLWTGICPEEAERTPLEVRARDLLNQLLQAGVGRRPVMFVCHSMGGLLVKNMLVMAYESGKPEMMNFAKNGKGIVFYSTPHRGSSFASLNTPASIVVMPSIEVQELRLESENLKTLHTKFLNLLRDIPMEIISFVETKATLISAMKIAISLVNVESANIGVGEYYEIPQDHLGICKPFNRQSFLYQRVVKLIKDIMTRVKRENATKVTEEV